VKRGWFPKRGDVVWLDFDPQAGREQAGRRPALILSADEYNRRVGLALCCPITSQKKGYPFEVDLPPGLPVTGVALVDQLRSLDWKARRAEFFCKINDNSLAEALAKVLPLLTEE
jgi:mRNA interferase MazF